MEQFHNDHWRNTWWIKFMHLKTLWSITSVGEVTGLSLVLSVVTSEQTFSSFAHLCFQNQLFEFQERFAFCSKERQISHLSYKQLWKYSDICVFFSNCLAHSAIGVLFSWLYCFDWWYHGLNLSFTLVPWRKYWKGWEEGSLSLSSLFFVVSISSLEV